MAANADGVRGIYATKNYAEGDKVLHIPFKLSVNLGDAAVGPPVCASREFHIKSCSQHDELGHT